MPTRRRRRWRRRGRRRRWRRWGCPHDVAVVMSSLMRRRSVMPSRCRHDCSDECDSGEERDDQFLLHNTPSFLFSGLVNECANDASDNCRAENCPAVCLVVFDVNDARRGRRRRSGMPHGSRMVGRCAVAGDVGAVRLPRLRGGCLLRRGGLLMLLGGSRSLAAPRCGSRQSRAANRHTRECRDCHLDDLLVHVTPTFPGFLPLHKARREKWWFLTQNLY